MRLFYQITALVFSIFLSSCVSHEVYDAPLEVFELEKTVQEPLGFELDLLSESSLDGGVLEQRRDDLKKFETSLLLIDEVLLLDFLKPSETSKAQENLAKAAQLTVEEDLNKELSDKTVYLALLIALKEKNFYKAHYFSFRLSQSKNEEYRAKALNIKGFLKLERGEDLSALSHFRGAFKISPEDPSVNLNLASLYVKFGYYNEAAQHLKSVNHHSVGKFLALLVRQGSQGQFISLAECQEFIDGAPRNKFFLFNCGSVAFSLHKQYDLAEKWLIAAMNVKSSQTDVDYKAHEMIKAMSQAKFQNKESKESYNSSEG